MVDSKINIILFKNCKKNVVWNYIQPLNIYAYMPLKILIEIIDLLKSSNI